MANDNAPTVKQKRWTAPEEKLVQEYYNVKGARWCAEELNRSMSSIVNKAHKLGVSIPAANKVWDDVSDLFLLENYAERGQKYCSLILRTTCGSVQRRAQRLGLTKSRRDAYDWSPAEVEWLLANYGALGAAECGRRLRRSASSVWCKMKRLRNESGGSEPEVLGGAWDKEDEERLKAVINWAAGYLGYPANTIINKAIDLRTVDTSWMNTGMAYNMNRQGSGE